MTKNLFQSHSCQVAQIKGEIRKGVSERLKEKEGSTEYKVKVFIIKILRLKYIIDNFLCRITDTHFYLLKKDKNIVIINK